MKTLTVGFTRVRGPLDRRSFLTVGAIAALGAMLPGRARAAASVRDAVPAFDLARFDGSGSVRLADLAGAVVVLDFFAHWCGPCARSAPAIEQEIRQHYARRKGNPQGVPVHVLAVNEEPDDAPATARFIKRHGPGLVVNDRDGAVLKALGGSALPYLVVLDGTAVTAAGGTWVSRYQKAGFEGADRLRAVIDALGKVRP